MCKKEDIIINNLIADAILWTDVPSDDDILEVEGWEAYKKVQQNAKLAYYRTNRSQKSLLQHFTANKLQQNPIKQNPYFIMKQEQTKNIILNGRITPVKEIINMVIQNPVEYEEVDIETTILEKHIETSNKIKEEIQIVKPVTLSIELPIIQSHPLQLTTIPSNEKFIKKKKIHTPVIYQSSFVDLFIVSFFPYIVVIFSILIILIVNL